MGAFKELPVNPGRKFAPPEWLALNAPAFEGKVLASPAGGESPFEINLLVESFSK